MKKHGLTTHNRKHPLFKTWCEMRYRCEKKTKHNFKYYGGRGIKVCERWNDFGAFVADMGERPDGATLDRIDPNGNYEPANCRWANKETQANNARSNRVLTVDGVAKTMSQWSAIWRVPVATIWARLNKGWDESDAVKRSVRQHRPYQRTQQANVRAVGKVG